MQEIMVCFQPKNTRKTRFGYAVFEMQKESGSGKRVSKNSEKKTPLNKG